MTQSAKKLLWDIARNQEPQDVFDKLKKGKNVQNQYKKIVQHQINLGIKDMHLPEPWNGHISDAKILFISSNPSIDPKEDFPTKNWSKTDVVNFFDNRFVNSAKGSVSKFWKGIAKYTSWIYPEDTKEMSKLAILDKYVAMTEVVHCKSKNEIGIKKCRDLELPFLSQILEEFNGEIVIFVGKFAKESYEKNKNLFIKTSHKCKIAEIYHPNARGLTDKKRKKDLLNQLRKDFL